jgi:hypothetical protein
MVSAKFHWVRFINHCLFLGIVGVTLGCVNDVQLIPPAASPSPSAGCAGGECPAATCQRADEACEIAEDCCSGLCQLRGASVGTCKATPGCNVAYDACKKATDCCSKVCLLGESGGRCQPLGGCHTEGERCASGSSCCSGFCSPGPEAVLRCKVVGCRRIGELCEKSDQCCDKDPLSCRTGADEISRCYGAPGILDSCQPTGALCAVLDQCCSGICILGPSLAPVCQSSGNTDSGI